MIVAISACLIAFSVITAFVFVSTVGKLLKSGVWCPWYIKVVAYVWLLIGIPADVLFNVVWGTWIFRERPREWLFTHRVKRHVSKTDWRGKKAKLWAEMLNAIDENHV